jgi:proteasome-associated ATPase
VVLLSAGAEKIGVIADPLRSTCLKPGDHLLMDPKSGYLLERLPKTDVEDLALEEVPGIGYRDGGGLAAQITAWRGLWPLGTSHLRLVTIQLQSGRADG